MEWPIQVLRIVGLFRSLQDFGFFFWGEEVGIFLHHKRDGTCRHDLLQKHSNSGRSIHPKICKDGFRIFFEIFVQSNLNTAFGGGSHELLCYKRSIHSDHAKRIHFE